MVSDFKSKLVVRGKNKVFQFLGTFFQNVLFYGLVIIQSIFCGSTYLLESFFAEAFFLFIIKMSMATKIFSMVTSCKKLSNMHYTSM